MRQQAMQYRLSDLQKSIVQWLYTELRQRQRAGHTGGVSYPELVRAIEANKVNITTSLRHLMQKGLVLVTLPHAEWARVVALTEQGEAYAKGQLKDTRRPSRRLYPADVLADEWSEDDRGLSGSLQAQRRWSRRREIYRRAQRWLWLEPE
jgi:hypothetical protein